jgi:hypothetical protein
MLGVGVGSSHEMICRGLLNHHEAGHSTGHASLQAEHERAETTSNLVNTPL